MKEKNILFMKVFVVMLASLFSSGFVQSSLDLLWFVVGITVMSILLFFVPIVD